MMPMKSFTLRSWLCLALLCIGATAMAQEQAESTELLTNCGFEEWVDEKPTGWTPTTSAGGATITQSTDAHEGQSAVLITNTSKNTRLASSELKLAAGTYVYSFYAKGVTAKSAFRPGYVPLTLNEDGVTYKVGTYKYLADPVTVTADWTLYSYEFTLDAEAMVNMVLMSSKSTGDLLVDDMSLTVKAENPDEPVEPVETCKYKMQAEALTGIYLIAANVEGTFKVANNLAATASFGYPTAKDATVESEAIDMDPEGVEWTIRATEGGYLIQDALKRFVYMTGTYSSLSVSESLPEAGAVWTISVEDDGVATIANATTGKMLQYNSGKTSYGAYAEKTYELPYLFIKLDADGKPVVPEELVIPEDPTPELPEGTLFSETFATGLGEFTMNTVIPEGGLDVWSYDANYKCAKATAYISGARSASESWLVSPAIDLTKATAATLTFDHAASYFKDLASEVTVWVREAGAAEWAQLTPQAYPTSFAFVGSGDISLSAYVGKSVEIGFKYTSTEEAACTYEIQNFLIEDRVAEELPQPKENGSKEEPLSVAQAIELYNTGEFEPTTWVKGYIVGFVSGNAVNATNAHFNLNDGTEAVASNMLIADEATQTDYTKCLVVQLSSGSAVRAALNLKDNADKQYYSVTLCGSLAKYFGVAGLKAPSEYVLGEKGEGPDAITPVVVADNVPVEVYTLDGKKVETGLKGLRRGIYIVKKGDVVRKKVIK